MSFDDLIRAGRDTDAMRLLARTDYESGRFGHTRMMLLVRVADKLDEAEAENAKLRKVVDAAKEWINCPCEDIRECLECTAFKFRNALAELDEEEG